MFELPRGPYPRTRLRRTRRFDWSRRLVSESSLSVDDLIWPIFVHPGEGGQRVESLPGVERFGTDQVVPAAERAVQLGIPAVAVFPVTPAELKTEDAAEAVNPDNLVCRTVRKIKDAVGDSLGVICDVALDPYSSHGHDGIVINGDVANDRTVEVLRKQAVVQADAGCDIIAPSDMMDGRIGAIRGRARVGEPPQRSDHVVRGKICQCFLWPVPRCRGIKWQFGRSQQENLPAVSGPNG